MDDPLPKMPLHLGSRATMSADMAAALYWAIDESGLRLPTRRDIARHARVSEATISRRLRDWRTTEERLAILLVSARMRTYPPGSVYDGWERWLPETDQALGDARVWLACMARAVSSPAVSEAVGEAWAREHDEVVRALTLGAVADEVPQDVVVHAEILRALMLGLSIRRVLDPGLSQDRAAAILGCALAALGHPDVSPASPSST